MVSAQYILDSTTIHTKDPKEMRSFALTDLASKAESDPGLLTFLPETSHYSRAKNI